MLPTLRHLFWEVGIHPQCWSEKQHPRGAVVVRLPRTVATQSPSDKWKPSPPLISTEIWEEQSCENVMFDDCWKERGREICENAKCIFFLSDIFCFRNTVLFYSNLVNDPCFEIMVHRQLAFFLFLKCYKR